MNIREADLNEIREALAGLLVLAFHIPTGCANEDCRVCPRNRAAVERAKSVLALLTPATLVPISDPKE